MMSLIRKLFGLCDHRWKIIQTINVEYSNDNGEVVQTFTRYHLQCEKCGDVKKRDMD